MKLEEHIGIWEGAVDPELCQIIIDEFEYWYSVRYSPDVLGKKFTKGTFKTSEEQFKGRGGKMQRDDIQCFMERVNLTIVQDLNKVIGECFTEYADTYPALIRETDPVSSWSCKVQRTSPGGGYHYWHCEDGCFAYRDRVCAWMVYLNDIRADHGGATEFFHQKFSQQPRIGTVLIWPANYTHAHRGGFLTGDRDKYIATGWFDREPGMATEALYAEAVNIHKDD